MQKNVLNFVIVVSLFAIVVAISRDYFFNDKTIQVTTINPTPIPTIVPSPAAPDLVACDNPYFSFKKGAKWNYNVTDNKTRSTFTTEIVKASPSSIDLQTITDAKQITISTMYCRKDGLYGLPVPILSLLTKNSTGSMSQLSSMIKIDTNFKLLPNKDNITLNNTWTTKVPISISLPINVPLGVSFKNTITNISSTSFPGVGQIKTAQIKSLIDLEGLGSFLPQTKSASASADNTFDYTIGEKVGITDFTLGKGAGSIDITLISFTP